MRAAISGASTVGSIYPNKMVHFYRKTVFVFLQIVVNKNCLNGWMEFIKKCIKVYWSRAIIIRARVDQRGDLYTLYIFHDLWSTQYHSCNLSIKLCKFSIFYNVLRGLIPYWDVQSESHDILCQFRAFLMSH